MVWPRSPGSSVRSQSSAGLGIVLRPNPTLPRSLLNAWSSSCMVLPTLGWSVSVRSQATRTLLSRFNTSQSLSCSGSLASLVWASSPNVSVVGSLPAPQPLFPPLLAHKKPLPSPQAILRRSTPSLLSASVSPVQQWPLTSRHTSSRSKFISFGATC